ncbi:class I SAM-dependent methyltransferase [Nesterenkonia flava]|uniref:Class I SAM-dependent methyltransferase n=1 Tax=Nesterenkonia flava TaxID=469799 RepID=A0ABU1FR52_9MICC|nr:class I SAM-dependent methyltransferase [Nesterenkonia flava]MDR5711098.1 class I SAM-dependent methyltransferase [Nesterenkonia flava]
MASSPGQVSAAYGARAAEYIAALGSLDAMAYKDVETITDWADGLEGLVLDAGCGPGHWTKLLQSRGVSVRGIDMVPAFIRHASRRYPDVSFQLGTLESLPAAAESLGGILAWYSIIHTEPQEVPGLLEGFFRSLRPGGSVLLGVFEGPDLRPFDHAVAPAYTWPVPEIRHALLGAGFRVSRTVTRQDQGSRPHAALIAERPAVTL